MVDCTMVSDKLYEYIFEELDEESSLEIKRHITECPSCHNEYKKLKKLLIDDMDSLIELKNNIKVPEELKVKVQSSLKPKPIVNVLKFAAAACILLTLVYSTPVLAYYVTQLPPINKYIDLDSNILVDFDEGKGQLVQKSSTMKDITFTVDGIIPKKDRTTILFTVKAPKDSNFNYAMPESGLNTMAVYDQFGTKYQISGGAMTVKSVNEDGEVKCIFDVEPLHFWSYKLNIRVTAMEVGIYNGSDMKHIKNTYGNWNADFYINRSNNWR